MKSFFLVCALLVASASAFAPQLFGVNTQSSRYVELGNNGIITCQSHGISTHARDRTTSLPISLMAREC